MTSRSVRNRDGQGAASAHRRAGEEPGGKGAPPGRRDNVEAEFAALRAAREDPSSPAATLLLKKALDSKHGVVIAGAAEIIGRAELTDLLPHLAPPFDRLMIDPAKTDRFCKGKIAIVDALARCSYDAPELYMRGVRHIQLEYDWTIDDMVDTAGGLRGISGVALARMDHREALNILAELFADADPLARTHAARGVSCVGRTDGAALLRYKALLGDDDPEVMAEVFGAMLAITSDSLPFVARFLKSDKKAVAEVAAIAIGESRRQGALDALKGYSEGLTGDERRTAYIAIALVRSDAAVDHLLGLIESAPAEAAAQAVSALGLYRHDQAVRKRVQAAADARGGKALARAFTEAFPPA